MSLAGVPLYISTCTPTDETENEDLLDPKLTHKEELFRDYADL